MLVWLFRYDELGQRIRLDAGLREAGIHGSGAKSLYIRLLSKHDLFLSGDLGESIERTGAGALSSLYGFWKGRRFSLAVDCPQTCLQDKIHETHDGLLDEILVTLALVTLCHTFNMDPAPP